MDQGVSCALTLHIPLCSSVYLTCPVLCPLSQMPGPEGILGTREVNAGVVFSKDPRLREDVHWGPGCGILARGTWGGKLQITDLTVSFIN